MGAAIAEPSGPASSVAVVTHPGPAGPEPAAPRRRVPRLPRALTRVPLTVWVITALHLGLLLSYSFVYPTWTGYDEAQHVDMVVGLEHGDGWPGPGQRIIAKGVAATSDAFDRGPYADFFLSGGKKRGSPSFAEITPTPRADRRSFEQLGGDAPVTDGRLSNQMVQHPPLIYAIGAVVLKVIPGSSGWPYDVSVWVLRLLAIAVVAPLPVLCWAAARRFGLQAPLAVAAAVLPLAVPGFTRVGATFNNDGILALSTGALTVLLAGVTQGDMRRRTAAWAGFWLAIALLSKAFALALPVVVVAAYLVGGRRTGRRLPWVPALLAVGLGSVLGGWWWVRNVILYGAVEPNGWGTDPPRREPLLLPKSFFTWFWYYARTIVDRFWGGLGVFEPPTLSPVAVIVATVVVVAAFVALFRRRPVTIPWAALTLLLPLAFSYLMVGERSYAEYRHYTRGIAVQGRYLYLGLVGVAVVTVAGLKRLLPGRERLLPVAMLVGALAMQLTALLAICTYYWLPRGVAFTPARIGGILAAIGRWSPFPVGVTLAPIAATAGLAVAALVLTARSARAGAAAD